MANGHGGSRPGTGGRRPGAGRKAGAAGATRRTRKTTELAEKLAGDGPLPLQVMLEAMRYYRENGDMARAAAIARDAAPYEHPRKSTVTVQGGDSPVEIKLTRDQDFYRNADRLNGVKEQ